MRGSTASKRFDGRAVRIGLGVVAVGALVGGGFALADSKGPKPDPVAVGSEIFHREWLPDDPRGHGGDGLGPAFNDSSCIACHNAGGSGGAGPASKNIDILSASNTGGFLPTNTLPGTTTPVPPTALFDLHAGFRTGSRTVVLHRFGIDPGYDAFRSKLLGTATAPGPQAQPFGDAGQFSGFVAMNNSLDDPAVRQGLRPDSLRAVALERIQAIKTAVLKNRAGMAGSMQVGTFIVSRSQRNPTPLFGLGLVDAIPESAIVAMAAKQAKETPQVAGRVARVADGRVGRLGWKGQTANSEDFVLNACAVEVGLEVPGHSQSMTPQAPRYKGPGLDLTRGECDALVAYVRALPRPVESAPAGSKFVEAGQHAFAKVGCAGCHAPKLGEVDGLYSDLLLHDMGDDTGDDGSYDGDGSGGEDDPIFPVGGVAQNQKPGRDQRQAGPKGARKREWRTPPLWGLRDSGPYLHDGRAQTIEQAVALHGGQGTEAAQKFFQLPPGERAQLEAFLKSLVAPGSAAPDLARKD